MYGYPEQFIPAPEIGAASGGPAAAGAASQHRPVHERLEPDLRRRRA